MSIIKVVVVVFVFNSQNKLVFCLIHNEQGSIIYLKSARIGPNNNYNHHSPQHLMSLEKLQNAKHTKMMRRSLVPTNNKINMSINNRFLSKEYKTLQYQLYPNQCLL